MDEREYQDLLQRYKKKVADEFGEGAAAPKNISSQEYTQFKQEIYPARYSFYEKACNVAEGILHLSVDPKTAVKYQKNIDMCHLSVTPSGVISLAYLLPLFVIIFGALGSYALFHLPFFIVFFLILGVIMIPTLQKIPEFMANTWRMKASNQMVQSIFYMVTYMRHTSNLERAIGFAADHLEPPLSLDFRKILWDVETQQYSTIRDSANVYLEKWQDIEKDFIESFHLVESSLFEGSEERRLALLDKGLDVILDGTYENMLHYAHDLKSPMTMLHMLGVILPILGLVVLPLVVTFISSSSPFVTALYISMLYNVSLPLGVYYLGKKILAKRPAGYGAADISEKEGVQRFGMMRLSLSKNVNVAVNPLYFSIMIGLVALLIGCSPLIIHSLNPDFEIPLGDKLSFMDYVCPPNESCPPTDKYGPYGIGASLLSLVVIAGLGGAWGLYYSLRSKNVIEIREKTKSLEEEFSSALFQLGNRLGDGLPAEIAFAKVAQTMQGTTSGEFFAIAEHNMTRLGMGLEQAIFDPHVGSLRNFPSNVIESSMKVLIESVRKGPRIAAQALLSMSRYIKEIHRVEERLKDLMEDVISSMKAQTKVLTPAIAGIVVGITSMISTILTKLSAQLTTFAGQTDVSSFSSILTLFGVGIPTFHFQIVVGVYIVQIAYILTILTSGIENGADKLGERFMLGKNLIGSTLLYCFIAGVVMLLFSLFANVIISNSGIGL